MNKKRYWLRGLFVGFFAWIFFFIFGLLIGLCPIYFMSSNYAPSLYERLFCNDYGGAITRFLYSLWYLPGFLIFGELGVVILVVSIAFYGFFGALFGFFYGKFKIRNNELPRNS